MTPSHASSASQTITVHGVDVGNSNIQARYGSTSGQLITDSITVVYNPKTYKLAIIVVNQEGWTSIAAPYTNTEIQSYLNETYKQACIQWNVDIILHGLITIDLNGDGKFNVANAITDYTTEMNNIITTCTVPGYNYYLFMVNNSDLPISVGGISMLNNHSGFLLWPMQKTPPDPPTLESAGKPTAHELGHMVGSIGDKVNPPSTDNYNLMYYSYGSDHNKLRLYQWNALND